ncbi:hypothetical protein B0H14DRAFT_3710336 [Mycena olivaceomarginata]|nr:hypothetical protein B0H14DRAFT_3710336 [Mycena olivaceomarginata]
MTLILAYCPGSKEWENRDGHPKSCGSFYGFGQAFSRLFDVNEGSKKGIIKMLKALQEISGLSESEWAARARIIVGDWLTSNNLRGARRDRMDDINSMERLDYVEELSALWHFALNATHMIMRLHFGDSVLNPGSLAKHKGLLNRTWDVKKPNYADTKALIRHSLISRILYEVIFIGLQFRITSIIRQRLHHTVLLNVPHPSTSFAVSLEPNTDSPINITLSTMVFERSG